MRPASGLGHRIEQQPPGPTAVQKTKEPAASALNSARDCAWVRANGASAVPQSTSLPKARIEHQRRRLRAADQHQERNDDTVLFD